MWLYPNIESEQEEIRRTSSELNIPIENILNAINSAQLVPLDDSMWSNLQNSDSWTVSDLSEAIQMGKEYGKNTDELLSIFVEGEELPSPIVLILPDGIPYLIAGNTRLMMSKAMNIRPTILLAILPNNLNTTAQLDQQLIKQAGLEKSNVTDTDSGKEIFVSTTARKMFRDAWPDDLGKVRNNILNLGVATLFAGGKFLQNFKPRGEPEHPQIEGFEGKGSGIIRQVEGGRFIAIEGEGFIKLIAVKGTAPKLPALPEGQKPAPYKASGGVASGAPGIPASEPGSAAEPVVPPSQPQTPEPTPSTPPTPPMPPIQSITPPEYHDVPAYPEPAQPVPPAGTGPAQPPASPEQQQSWWQRFKGLFQ